MKIAFLRSNTFSPLVKWGKGSGLLGVVTESDSLEVSRYTVFEALWAQIAGWIQASEDEEPVNVGFALRIVRAAGLGEPVAKMERILRDILEREILTAQPSLGAYELQGILLLRVGKTGGPPGEGWQSLVFSPVELTDYYGGGSSRSGILTSYVFSGSGHSRATIDATFEGVMREFATRSSGERRRCEVASAEVLVETDPFESLLAVPNATMSVDWTNRLLQRKASKTPR